MNTRRWLKGTFAGLVFAWAGICPALLGQSADNLSDHLLLAVMQGNEQKMKELVLLKEVDPNKPNWIGQMAIIYAPYGGGLWEKVDEHADVFLDDNWKTITRLERYAVDGETVLIPQQLMSRLKSSFTKEIRFSEKPFYQPTKESLERGRRMSEFLLEHGADPASVDRVGTTVMHSVAHTGDVVMAELLLDNEAPLDGKQYDGTTPLIKAANAGHVEMVEWLLDRGVSIHSMGNNKWSALHHAATKGSEDVARLLIQRGAAIQARDSSGYTPLHTAAEKGQKEVVSFLLEQGANPNTKEPVNGKTPLSSAADGGYLEVIQLLIKGGARINWNTGDMALHNAALHAYPEIVELLISNGADVNVKIANAMTPLHRTVNTAWGTPEMVESAQREAPDNVKVLYRKWSDEERFEVVRLLVEAGANVNAKDRFGNMPLHLLANQWGYLPAAKFLIENGAEADPVGQHEATPLISATGKEKGYLELVKLLLDEGADLSRKEINGATVLQVAISNGHDDIVEYLLEQGAPVLVADKVGQTPAYLCILQNRLEILKMLHRSNPEVLTWMPNSYNQTLLHRAAGMRNKGIVQFLLENGLDPNAVDIQKTAPLHYLTKMETLPEMMQLTISNYKKSGIPVPPMEQLMKQQYMGTDYREVAELLLDAGADIDLRGTPDRATPLQAACMRGRLDVAEVLVECGADYTTGDPDWGALPIHNAADWAHTDIVQMFLDMGMNPDVRDRLGGTPLFYASRSGFSRSGQHAKAAKILLEAGANVDEPANNGQTPLQIAVERKRHYAVEVLLNHGASVSKPALSSGKSPMQRAVAQMDKAMVAILGARLNMTPVQSLWYDLGNEEHVIAEVEGEIIRASDAIAYSGGMPALFSDVPISDLKDSGKLPGILEDVRRDLNATGHSLVHKCLIHWLCEVADIAVPTGYVDLARKNLIRRLMLDANNLDKSLRLLDWSEDDFDRICQWQAAADMIHERYLDSESKVSEKQIQEFYEMNPGRFGEGRKVRLQMMAIDSPAILDMVMGQLNSGASFDSLASKYSQDPSGKMGGYLPWMKPESMNQAFSAAFKEFKTGEIGKPVSLGNRTYVLRIDEIKDASLVPLESVSMNIEKELIKRAKTEAEERLARALKMVAVAEDYLDPRWD